MRTSSGSYAFSLKSIFISAIYLASLIFVIGCAPRHPSFSSVTGKGVLPVSGTNPFMGANIFLAHEMEESTYLYNFLKKEGAPQAIRLTGQIPASATLELFYVNRLTLYRATTQRDLVLGHREWIIEGPYPISRKAFQSLHGIQGKETGIFEVFGKREILDGRQQTTSIRSIPPVFVPTPKPRKPAIVRKKRRGKKQPAKSTPVVAKIDSRAPMNYDQKALFEARKSFTPLPKDAQQASPSTLESALSDAVHP